MRKTKTQKGITLIALIITIVVLLILAVVAINAVTGDGIIQHAVNAKTSYENAQAKEEEILSYYETYLTTKGNVGPWKQEGNYITMTDSENNTIKIPIGAEVKYEPIEGKTYTSKDEVTGAGVDQVFTVKDTDTSWKVMGLQDGKIVLVASNLVTPTVDGVAKDMYTFTGYEVLTKGPEELNSICSIYKDATYAESARSINENDIIKLCGITEEDKKIGGAYKVDDEILYEYGIKYSYIFGDSNDDGTDDVVMYKRSSNESYISTGKTEVIFHDGTRINSTNKGPKEITTSNYKVNIDNKENTWILDAGNFWLANMFSRLYEISQGQSIIEGDIFTGMIGIGRDFNGTSDMLILVLHTAFTGGRTLSDSNNVFKVRPTVVLKSNVQLQEDGKDASNNTKYKLVQK